MGSCWLKSPWQEAKLLSWLNITIFAWSKGWGCLHPRVFPFLITRSVKSVQYLFYNRCFHPFFCSCFVIDTDKNGTELPGLIQVNRTVLSGPFISVLSILFPLPPPNKTASNKLLSGKLFSVFIIYLHHKDKNLTLHLKKKKQFQTDRISWSWVPKLFNCTVTENSFHVYSGADLLHLRSAVWLTHDEASSREVTWRLFNANKNPNRIKLGGIPHTVHLLWRTDILQPIQTHKLTENNLRMQWHTVFLDVNHAEFCRLKTH